LPDVTSPIGRRAAVFGVVAEPDSFQIRGHIYGISEASTSTTAPLVLNEGTVALLGIRGLSDTVTKAADAAGANSGAASLIDPNEFAKALGDLAEVQVALDAAGDPVVQGTVVSSDVSAAEEFWQSLAVFGGLSVTTEGNQVTIAEPDAVGAFGPATSLDPITSVLPNAATANVVLWADINALEQSSEGAGFDARTRELKAVGLSISTATEGDAEILGVAQFD
jgi:hypothetical protein